MDGGLRLRIVLRKGVAFGPGKADLLQAIRDAGSIAAAGRSLGMSYSRAWQLVDAMNHEVRGPLVTPAKGGAVRGGASLTELGIEVLARYRALEQAAERSKEVAALRRSLA